MKTCTPPYSSSPFIISLILILVTINAQTTSAYSYSTAPTIFRRQSACDPASSPTICDVKGFCCPGDSQCIPIENNTSVICCKKGEYCDQIYPIGCQSAPSTTESTNANRAPKPILCGSSCCPLGYECGSDKDRCVMKNENIPEDHRKYRKEQERKKLELEACLGQGDRKTNGTNRANAGREESSRNKFSPEGLLVGLFSGIALGAGIMFGYTKIVEMKTRRRTINFNNPSPDDISWAERKSHLQQFESIAIGYSPHLNHPGSRNISPANWKPITPADLSPNLGPTIPPRERSTSRDRVESRMASSRNTTRQTPSPHPLAGSPLEPRAQSVPRSSTDSETDHSESFLSSTISNTRASSSIQGLPPPDRASYQRQHFSSEVASVITDSGLAFSYIGLDSRVTPGTEKGRGRSGISTDTGYSDSVYQDGSSLQQPFIFEDEIPPFHISSAQSSLTPVQEQSPFATPPNPNSMAMGNPFVSGTPPSRFGGF
ncbi:hypothetical protein HOY80DRAFT_81416 [Tuber brumale]|nr:hypothetical protein HOY80DRAFT_81416 [Tuber brumale]